jgi:hypothetical protein
MSRDPNFIGSFTSARWGRVEAHRREYALGGSAVVLIDSDGARLATLSTRLEGPTPGWPRFWAKAWSENEELAREALVSGLFRDTGVRRRSGFVEAQLWEVVTKD